MTIEEIKANKEMLEQQLKFALASMDRKDDVKIIREKIKLNQSLCPHCTDYSLIKNNTCPYCGFHYATGGLVQEAFYDKYAN